MDYLLEASRKKASDVAKSRLPPSAGSASDSTKRRKASSSNVDSTRPSSIQAQIDNPEAQYWTLDQKSGEWFQRHSNGSISWAEEER
jgi:hypothetical protein